MLRWPRWLRPPLLGSGLGIVVYLVLCALCVLGFRYFQTRVIVGGTDCVLQCERLPSTTEIELAFSGLAFRDRLLASCTVNPALPRLFKWLLGTVDMVFPVAYAGLLYSLYVWLTARLGTPPRPTLLGAPWLAAIFDYAENLLTIAVLWNVGTCKEVPATFPSVAIALLSTASALKWTFAAVAVGGLVLRLLETAVSVGSATVQLWQILWICRFNLGSVLLGSAPILLVPQGHDMLRSLVESETSWLVRCLTLLFLVLWALSVWYWGRVLLVVRLGALGTAGLARWVPRILGWLTLVLPGIACLLTALREWGGRWLVLYGLACLALSAVFLWVVSWRRRYLENRAPEQQTPPGDGIPRWRGLRAGTQRVVLASALISGGFFAAFTLASVSVAPWMGSLAVVAVAAANAVFFGSATVFLAWSWRLPFVTCALVLAALFSLWNDNHAVRLVPGAAAQAATPPRLALGDWFAEWLEARKAEGDRTGASPLPIPVFLVAAEGGGIRAAYWTALALARIQDRASAFGSHVFAVSGVSGGSVGAAVFDALLAEEASGSTLDCAVESGDELIPAPKRLQRCAHAALARNFLAPVLAKMVAPDFAQWFLPVPVAAFDRAWALEDSWAKGFRGAFRGGGRDRLSEPFLDLWKEHPTQIPALLLNGAHVESGRRLVLTSFAWDETELLDAYDLLRVLKADLPLKTAAHSSARFAFVSPAGRLRAADGADQGHVVDGGYFENSGAVSLRDLRGALDRVLERHPRLAGDPTLRSRVRFYLIYLCNNPLRCGRRGVDAGSVEPPPRQGLAEAFAPVRALLGAREARASLALREVESHGVGAAFSDVFEIGVCPMLAEQERKAPLPLGWQLSKDVREAMIGQLASCRKTSGEEVALKDCRLDCLRPIDNGATIERIVGLLPRGIDRRHDVALD